jgi:hypothetical protein
MENFENLVFPGYVLMPALAHEIYVSEVFFLSREDFFRSGVSNSQLLTTPWSIDFDSGPPRDAQVYLGARGQLIAIRFSHLFRGRPCFFNGFQRVYFAYLL